MEFVMLITPAFAQTAAASMPGGSDLLISVAPFAFIFAILYFLMIRPQQRRVKQHQDMIGNLRRGDVVVTAGGVIGKVDRLVDEGEAILDLGDEVKVRVVRSMISEVRSKTEPVKAANDETDVQKAKKRA